MTYVIFFAVSILASVVGAICGVGGEKRLWTSQYSGHPKTLFLSYQGLCC